MLTALSGPLRVDMPAEIAGRLVTPRLDEFRARHLEIELGCSDRRIDPLREGFDCVLRIGAIDDDSLARGQYKPHSQASRSPVQACNSRFCAPDHSQPPRAPTRVLTACWRPKRLCRANIRAISRNTARMLLLDWNSGVSKRLAWR
ncbi:hypothetical protein CDO35_20640 [Pseudomonas sediminis]|uniref:LysR substrate-binding domain-containing protein n=1 Tax=Pseudomonas sediminis TaxID=1691904 RepID=A0A2G5FE66_9PSED|nr:hypothetical protein CDO35_20640 [Pseudomonas sediminis]